MFWAVRPARCLPSTYLTHHPKGVSIQGENSVKPYNGFGLLHIYFSLFYSHFPFLWMNLGLQHCQWHVSARRVPAAPHLPPESDSLHQCPSLLPASPSPLIPTPTPHLKVLTRSQAFRFSGSVAIAHLCFCFRFVIPKWGSEVTLGQLGGPYCACKANILSTVPPHLTILLFLHCVSACPTWYHWAWDPLVPFMQLVAWLIFSSSPIVFCCVSIPQLIYPVSHCWALGLFLLLSHCK